jgi:hypothetical protein
MILIWAASSILFQTVRWNVTERYSAGLSLFPILFLQSSNLIVNLLYYVSYDIIIGGISVGRLVTGCMRE